MHKRLLFMMGHSLETLSGIGQEENGLVAVELTTEPLKIMEQLRSASFGDLLLADGAFFDPEEEEKAQGELFGVTEALRLAYDVDLTRVVLEAQQWQNPQAGSFIGLRFWLRYGPFVCQRLDLHSTPTTGFRLYRDVMFELPEQGARFINFAGRKPSDEVGEEFVRHFDSAMVLG